MNRTENVNKLLEVICPTWFTRAELAKAAGITYASMRYAIPYLKYSLGIPIETRVIKGTGGRPKFLYRVVPGHQNKVYDAAGRPDLKTAKREGADI